MIADLLPLFIAVPLLSAAIVIIFPRNEIKLFLLVIAPLFSLIYSALLLVHHRDGETLVAQIGGWPARISIPFVSDNFSSLMLFTTSLLILVCTLFAIASKDWEERYFTSLVLVLSAGVYGAILTSDLFNLFVFIELLFLPSCGLIVLRKGIKYLAAPRLYVTVNLLASGIILVGISLIYATQGSVNLAALLYTARDSQITQAAVGVLLIGLGVKAALFPAHGWLARTYPATSPVVSALFSGLHTKVAIYAIFRIYSVMFGVTPSFIWFFTILFIASMLVGGFGALGEANLRSILTFHMVSQIGYIMLGLVFFSIWGLSAAIYFLIHNMVVKVSLFLSLGALEESYGTGSLKKLHAMVKKERVVAVTFFLGALSLAGLPPFSGFIAKLFLAQSALETNNILALSAIIGVSIITLMSMLKIWDNVFWQDRKYKNDILANRDPNDEDVATLIKLKSKVPLMLISPAIVLVAISLFMGINGDFLIEITNRAASDLINADIYSKAVLGQ